MTGLEAHLASTGHALGGLGIRGQAFVHQRSDGRRAYSRAQPFPIDGWPSVEHHVALHTGDDFTRWSDVDKHLLRIQDAPQGYLVRGIDPLPPEAAKKRCELSVAIGGWTPVDALDRDSLSAKGVREQPSPSAQHAHRAFEEWSHQTATPSTIKLAATAA
jgi:hypothetical protein